MPARLDLRAANGGGATSGARRPLSDQDKWDAMVIAEAKCLEAWAGLTCSLVHASDGTAACEDNTIFVDRKQIQTLFAGFTGARLRTAIFFVLAHEFGHLLQFKVLGPTETFNRPSVLVEGHADYLSGIWLGLRLVDGDLHDTADLLAIGLALKGTSAEYPTPNQRGLLVQAGMGLAVTLAYIAEPQIKDSSYERAASGVKDSDVTETYDIVVRRLDELPRT